ncbi:YfcL family protein [Aliiglaciecola litoralis]|uniref:YfcL family protein n=1 Tax=Aliiglaciecola litoralis TaxID=582857 RepID=A0ABP3X3D8_9ALTE
MHANEFEQSVEQIENKLDQTVEWGSDDELFISSYLHGHVSLAVSHAELSQQKTLKQLDALVSTSLQDAFANNELELVDQQKVTRLWSQLIDQASNDTINNAS